MSNSNTHDSIDGIAIIGLAGRFPGAKNVEEFWRNLRDGVEAISFFSDEELKASGVGPAMLEDPSYVKAHGALEGIEWFDAAFFGINPREAEIMDPQHRLFQEAAWEALESAGYNPEKYEGAIGVYAGVGVPSYAITNVFSNPGLRQSVGALQTSIRNRTDHLTTQVSYKFNLRGPGVTVQTACSTSLVAVHLACQSLLNNECDMALAGGCSLAVPHKAGYYYQEGGILSPDGHCRPFDARARGTVPGSGVGIVILKRLADALEDGDCIHAVIKGSAINNDGFMKVGYTAPGVDGQAEVIAEAMAVAGVDPETISYIEAHGTGTNLGDPIEIEALTRAFRDRTDKKGFCAIGAVKSNIGHLDTAAGVAGLIKTVLALKHRQIPPSLHYEQPNPRIDFENNPFYVNTRLSEWKSEDTPRRAGVSSFGLGGTNAHVVLEEAPLAEASTESRPWQVLLLSARTNSALENATVGLAEYLKHHTDVDLADVAYTLKVGRKAFAQRRAVICRDGDAVAALETLDPKTVYTSVQEPRERPVVFMFPGQGAQYVNMGLELYQVEPTFREQVARCCELLVAHLGFDLREVLYPGQERIEEAAEKLKQTYITQPALFVIEYALARLWMEWGVRPETMIGHSIGEYVAACLAGVLSLEDALALVAARGRLMQSLPEGAMLSVPLSEKEALPLVGERLSLAAVNGPSLCVVSGPTDAVDELEQRLTQQGLGPRRLHTSHAFHSRMMDPILEQFAREVKKVELKPPTIPYLSNVTGTWIRPEEATDPDYWVRHLRGTVRFADGVSELVREPDWILLEAGPGRTLMTIARWYPGRAAGQLVLTSLPHVPHVQEAAERESDIAFLLASLGRLWLAGVQVDWSGFYTHERRSRIPLPTYPFERQRYWIEAQAAGSGAYGGLGRQAALHKKPDIADWFYVPSWKRSAPPLPPEPSESPNQTWLLFDDECGLGAQLTQRLEEMGQDVISVAVGEAFGERGDGVYTIAPRRGEDYKALLQSLRARNKTPGKIVHLWNVAPEAEPEKSLDLSFYSLIFLAQALGAGNNTDPLQIEVVTNNMQEVVGSEVTHPERATAIGACRAISQEYENITCRSIDLSCPNASCWQDEKLADHLIAEFFAKPKPAEMVIAYRGHHRWEQTFEPMLLGRQQATAGSHPQHLGGQQATAGSHPQHLGGQQATAGSHPQHLGGQQATAGSHPQHLGRQQATAGSHPQHLGRQQATAGSHPQHLGRQQATAGSHPQHFNGRSPRLRSEGVYLVTGGLGGIGLELAEYLARTVKAKLVLIGRSAFPERATWDTHLSTHDEQDALSYKIRKLRAIEELGAEVMVLSADVADRVRMQEVVALASARFGPIHGVIHSAGVAGGGMIQLKTPEMAHQVLSPKVQGTRVLEEVFKDGKLDFLALCSSRSSILGGFGQVDYAAANAFLDSFAHYRNAKNGNSTVSINWAGWQEVGMRVDTLAQLGVKAREKEVAVEEIGHPLLQRCIEKTAERETYSTNFSVATHWVLDDHRIVRQPIIPGTTYLEMVRAALALHAGDKTIELRDVYFLSALPVREDETKEVRAVIEKNGDGFEFRVISKAPSANGEVWQEYVMGKARLLEPEPPVRHDIKALIEKCNDQEIIIADDNPIINYEDLGPRWQSLKKVYLGRNELVAVLELPEAFAADVETYKLHPALLDRANFTAKVFLAAEGLHLPLGYKGLRIKQALPGRVYAYAKYKPTDDPLFETITFDVILMDENGLELVEVDEFSQKRVREATETMKAMATRGRTLASNGASETERRRDGETERRRDGETGETLIHGMSPGEGVDAFSRILANKGLSQVVVSPEDLLATIEQARDLREMRLAEGLEKLEVSRPKHARPDVQTAYVAPRNEVEQTLADIWQETLGIEQVGIQDNFFELGGDSVVGIQMIARFKRAGYQLSPQQLFQNQTITELAASLGIAQPIQAEQGIVTGPVPLMPGQHWFFEQNLPEPHHFNQAMLFDVRQTVDPALLEAACGKLLEHHDALRLRFEPQGLGRQQATAGSHPQHFIGGQQATAGSHPQHFTGWGQINAGAESEVPLTRVDLSHLPAAEQEAARSAKVAELQASLNLSRGPLAQFALFDLGPGKARQLLIVIHYLVFDNVSWWILLSDLDAAYQQLGRNEAIQLPPKTSSYKQWAESLTEFAQSAALQQEAAYWLAESRGREMRLPVDNASGANTAGSAGVVSVSLEVEETQALLHEVQQVYHTVVNDLLLTALVQACAPWTGEGRHTGLPLLIDLEDHGREALVEGLDLSHTVGSFRAVYPMLLELRGAGGEALKSIKEQLRGVPGGGIGYGLLRYSGGEAEIAARLRDLPRAEVKFSYLGQLDQVLPQSSPFTPRREAIGRSSSPLGNRSYLLEVNGAVRQGRLQLDWTYSENVHRRTTVELLARDFVKALRELIAHCQSPEAGGHTPSDFGLAKVNQQQLDSLMAKYSKAD